jgi:hypothetical protein
MPIRIIEVESIIRNSQIHKIEFQFEYFSKSKSDSNSIKITFIKWDREYIELTMNNPISIDLIDEKFENRYISCIKVIQRANSFEISLDPYDEQILNLQEEDNYCFKSKSYEISKTQI